MYTTIQDLQINLSDTIGYGLTETAPVTHFNTTQKGGRIDYSSIGMAIHNMEYKVSKSLEYPISQHKKY